MNRFFILLPAASLMFAIMIAAEEKTSMSYALQFRAGHTVGTWVLAIDNKITYEITDFSKDSNRSAVEALAALHPEIVRLNTNPEHNIYLVGEMKKGSTNSIKAGEMGQAEMRLDGWYIKAPFYLPPESDPEGKLRVSTVLTAANFLPAGERPDSEATRKLRSSLVIHHDKKLNVFWVGAGSPFNRFIENDSGK